MGGGRPGTTFFGARCEAHAIVLRIATLNVNGLRSAAAKGVLRWMRRVDPDVLCVQEIKANEADLPAACRVPRGWHAAFCSARRKGYAGTALYAKIAPRRVQRGFGVAEFDDEGRYLEAEFAKLTVISVYFPSGSAGPERQASKFRFLAAFLPHLARLQASGREVILCGDVNMAHREIDLKNWRANQNYPGFTPEERGWLTELFDRHGWVDVFRKVDARPEQYTWWSNRGQAWKNNVGWRIDYQIATPGIAARAQRVEIYKRKRFSDHAPLVIDYDANP